VLPCLQPLRHRCGEVGLPTPLFLVQLLQPLGRASDSQGLRRVRPRLPFAVTPTCGSAPTCVANSSSSPHSPVRDRSCSLSPGAHTLLPVPSCSLSPGAHTLLPVPSAPCPLGLTPCSLSPPAPCPLGLTPCSLSPPAPCPLGLTPCSLSPGARTLGHMRFQFGLRMGGLMGPFGGAVERPGSGLGCSTRLRAGLGCSGLNKAVGLA